MTILPGLIWGVMLGMFFFGGLWLTVRWLPRANRPRLLWLGSFMARMTVLVVSFVFLARQGGLAAMAGVGSLLAVRWILVRWLGPGTRELEGQGG